MSRRWFVPEVIQTSEMDCGPAALKSVLDGFGVPVSYGRLREACQTSVDGTSIDTLEAVAGLLGIDAQQVMLPADHVLRPATVRSRRSWCLCCPTCSRTSRWYGTRSVRWCR